MSEIIDAVLKVWPEGIDVEPYGDGRLLVPAKQVIVPEEDGLDNYWWGDGNVFIHPPLQISGGVV
jgi:hypothetical protein